MEISVSQGVSQDASQGRIFSQDIWRGPPWCSAATSLKWKFNGFSGRAVLSDALYAAFRKKSSRRSYFALFSEQRFAILHLNFRDLFAICITD